MNKTEPPTRCVPCKKETVHRINDIENRERQRTFGTFASPYTQADASACKRAKFLPTLKDYIK